MRGVCGCLLMFDFAAVMVLCLALRLVCVAC